MLSKVQADSKKFQSTLVVYLVSIINIWVTEYIKQFNTDLRLYIMHRLKTQTSDSWHKNLTINFFVFADLLDFFDKIDILTVRIMILTAYSTWAKRSLKVISTSYKKIMTETAINNHNEQTSFKAIDSNNSVNDSEKSNDKTFLENNNIINNNENK